MQPAKNTLLFALLALILTAPTASAFPEADGRMTFGGLQAALENSKELPSSYTTKLSKTAQGVLEQHLSEMEALAQKSGLLYRRNGRVLEILPGPATAMNREAETLARLGLKSFVYDPAFLAKFFLAGAYDTKTHTLYTSIESVSTGEVDSLLHHEIVHARHSLGADEVPGEFRLIMRSTGKKNLRDDATIYPRFLSADELLAYVAELRFLLTVPGATDDVSEETGVTPFADKVLLFDEVLLTVGNVTKLAAKEKPVDAIGLRRYKHFEVYVECTACAEKGADVTPLVALLGKRATALRKVMAEHEAKEMKPEALVEALEQAVR